MTIEPSPESWMQKLAGRPLLRNAGFLTLSRGVTILSGLVVTAWLGRRLGPESFGILGFAAAVVSYFGLIVAIGLETLGTREVARHEARVRMIASHIVTLRLALALVALSGLAVVVAFIDRPALVKVVIALHGLGLLAVALNLDFVYQGRARMGVIAGREISVALLTLAGVLLFVHEPDHVVVAALIVMAALLAGSGLVLARCWRDFRAPALRVDWRLWRRLIVAALPIAMVGMLVTIYRNIDLLLLGFLRTAGDVGQYAAAFKFFTTGLAPVMILLAAFTPLLARAWGQAGELRRVTSLFGTAVAATMVPVAGVGIAFAPELILFLFGPLYLPAADAARLLLAATLAAGLNVAFGHPLMLWGHQRKVVTPLAFGAVLHAALNLVLIPPFGIVGAAATTLVCEIILAAWFARIQIAHGGRFAAAPLAGHMLAGAAAGMVSWYVAYRLGMLVPAPGLIWLLTGPALFVIIYGVLVGPYWWRRLLRDGHSR